MWDFPLFPESASSIAWEVDLLYFVLIGLSAIITIGVVACIVYFSVKYRRGADVDRSNPVHGSLKIETTWAVIPLILGLGMFTWAAFWYFTLQRPPRGDTLELYAIGKQWMWKFQHPSGAREINTLHVPVGQTVQMTMTSQDVIHSFYVPAFRIKQDVLPGRYTSIWFKATEPGKYHLFCAEYCGTEHSYMRGWVYVMRPSEYEQWLRTGSTGGSNTSPGTGRYERTPTGGATEEGFDAGAPNAPLRAGPFEQGVPEAERIGAPGARAAMAQAGAALFGVLRCNTCHRVDSAALYPAIGPNLDDLYGHPVELQNNRSVIADEQYLRQSILYPQAKLAAGYPPVMPTFQGQISEMELLQLIAYLKSLSAEAEPAADTTGATPTDTDGAPPADTAEMAAEAAAAPSLTGAALFRRMACPTCHAVDPEGGAPGIGPPLYDLYGSEVALQSGRTVTADEAYLRESILHARAEIVAGYMAVMPNYEGQLTEEEVSRLVTYIMSL